MRNNGQFASIVYIDGTQDVLVSYQDVVVNESALKEAKELSKSGRRDGDITERIYRSIPRNVVCHNQDEIASVVMKARAEYDKLKKLSEIVSIYLE